MPRIVVLRVRDRLEPSRHLADVVVEAVEERVMYPGGGISHASLRLQYEVAVAQGDAHAKAQGSFHAGYSAYQNLASLTSTSPGTGALFLNLPSLGGHRIGTYLMNRLVEWIKEFPDAEVASIGLNEGQAEPENRDRRNRFYEQFGIVFDYLDGEKKAGRSRSMKVAQLQPVDRWQKNISELTFDQYLCELLYQARQQRWDIERLERVAAAHDKEISAHEAKPIRWAIGFSLRRIWRDHGAWLVFACLVVTLLYQVLRGVIKIAG